ncbi:MAG: BrnT family toxin [Deltaproteobacteria bacterium]|nr:BrnT family toxin [Deltaproteobacteria bacterium]
MEFEWNATKDLTNRRKHKVSFAEAVETFFDPKSFQMVDKKHSRRESRFYWIGKSNGVGIKLYRPWGLNPVVDQREELPLLPFGNPIGYVPAASRGVTQ